MKATEYLLKVFVTEGVNHLFMVPGNGIDYLTSALKTVPEMQAIVATHEGGAAFMADGYAKVSGKFGVALGIGGPGITNMMTGITTAYSDQTPLFIVTGEPPTDIEGRGAFQDTSNGGFSTHAFLSSVTNKRMTVPNVALLEHHVDVLLRNMLGASAGPVQLDFPMNVQSQDVDLVPRKLPESFYHSRDLDKESCDKIWEHLASSSKIAVLAGMGTLHSEASSELVRFAEKFDVPVATTLAAKGVFPEDHPLALGVLGWFGNPYALETIHGKEIEVLLVLGSRLNQVSTLKWAKSFLPSKALIINDTSIKGYFGNYRPDLFVLGDNQTFLRELNTSSQNAVLLKTREERKKWMENIKKNGPNYYDIENLSSDIVPIHPTRVIKELRQVMPKETIVFSGEGASSFIESHYWTSYGPRQHFSQVKSMSPMGWSICAAIGGKVAKPDVPVVAIIGDGSMLMHGLEIQTAARYGLAVIFVVMNNGAHGNPQLRARKIGEFETNFLNLPFHDWAKIAEGLGLVGMSVTEPDQLADTFAKALAINKPVLIDIRTGNYNTPVKMVPF